VRSIGYGQLESWLGGCVIGRYGETIAQVRESSGASIDVGNIHKHVPHRILTVVGTATEVSSALSLIADEIAPDIPVSLGQLLTPAGFHSLRGAEHPNTANRPVTHLVSLLVSKQLSLSLIGFNGCEIRRIRHESKATILLSRDVLQPSGEKLLVIAGGDQRTFSTAIILILENLALNVQNPTGPSVLPLLYRPEPHTPCPLIPRYPKPWLQEARAGTLYRWNHWVSSEAIGAVLGKKGRTISTIRAETGARVNVHDADWDRPNERLVSVTGPEEAVRNAANHILAALQHFEGIHTTPSQTIPSHTTPHQPPFDNSNNAAPQSNNTGTKDLNNSAIEAPTNHASKAAIENVPETSNDADFADDDDATDASDVDFGNPAAAKEYSPITPTAVNNSNSNQYASNADSASLIMSKSNQSPPGADSNSNHRTVTSKSNQSTPGAATNSKRNDGQSDSQSNVKHDRVSDLNCFEKRVAAATRLDPHARATATHSAHAFLAAPSVGSAAQFTVTRPPDQYATRLELPTSKVAVTTTHTTVTTTSNVTSLDLPSSRNDITSLNRPSSRSDWKAAPKPGNDNDASASSNRNSGPSLVPSTQPTKQQTPPMRSMASHGMALGSTFPLLRPLYESMPTGPVSMPTGPVSMPTGPISMPMGPISMPIGTFYAGCHMVPLNLLPPHFAWPPAPPNSAHQPGMAHQYVSTVHSHHQ
jgi:hypothetical protein